MKRTPVFIFLHILFFISASHFPQPSKVMNSSELKVALEKLNVLGTVLYIAAHPDDENTGVLSYFSTGKHLRTGYLSITRGDGGQNLIGNEQDELLGIIRTQELLSARRIDGAEQFFTRAIDFGYTKSADEALEFWGKEETLSDVVWIIRKFQPDIIITRFPPTGEGGHGHHTASSILAKEAFELAGDSTKFPEQLKYVNTWMPKRLYWNGWISLLQDRNENMDAILKIDVGQYNPLLGKSYSEIAAESRTMHKSQGFGSSGRRGENLNYFQHIIGDTARTDLFEGFDLSWNRVENSEKISSLLSKAREEFNPENPSGILTILLQAYEEMKKHSDNFWINKKKEELLELIRSAAGLWIEATTDNYSYSPGSKIEINAGIVNRSGYPLKLDKINLSYSKKDSLIDINLSKNNFVSHNFSFILPDDIKITQPYWLINKKDKFRYNVDNQELIGQPENKPELTAEFILSAGSNKISFVTPVLYRWTDPVEGEKYRPIEIIPRITADLREKIFIFTSDESREIIFSLRNNVDSFDGKVKLNLPANWDVTPSEIPINFIRRNEEKRVKFVVIPPAHPEETEFTIEVISGNKNYNKEIVTVSYPHIQTQTLFPAASAKLIRINTEKIVNSIGYVEGSGDEIPEYLELLGYKVEILSDNQLENDLLKYDAIITGIRAYNTRERLTVLNKNLLNYVHNGGTLIVQYNTNGNLAIGEIGPYPFQISRDRVTDEESPVVFLNPDHLLLNHPNKITEKDFEGWVQERGLYFTNEADKRYDMIISMNDKDEGLLNGGLIFTNYGKGVFIYTSLSFFRQLPAGVPGAYRLFINLISAGNQSG